MEIKFGDVKITFPYEKYIVKHSMENPFSTMLLKSNQDFINAFFNKSPMDYYVEYKNMMDKFANMSNPGKNEE